MAKPERYAPTTLGERRRERDGGWFTVTDAVHRPGQILRAHAHRFPAITIVHSGAFRLDLGNETVDCDTTGVFFKLGGHVHANHMSPRGSNSLIVELRSDTNRLAARDLPLPSDSFWSEEPRSRSLATEIAAEVGKNDIASELALEGLVLELVASLLRGSAERVERGAPGWLTDAEDVLRSRFRDPLSLNDLATIVGRHPAHLARAFRRRHGRSVGDFLRHVRLEHAAELLRDSEMAVGAIAHAVGFYDHAHFARCFRQWQSVTPTQYRAAHSD